MTIWDRIRTGLGESTHIGPVLMAGLVGLAGGAGAIVFRWLIDGVRWVSETGLAGLFGGLGGVQMVVVVAVGLVLVTLIVQRWAPEAQGHGVPEVQFAVRKHGGRIRPRVAVVKSLASALCIGTGGSVGREGPIVQIGCSLGSSLGQKLGLRDSGVRLLLACGAAAAIGGTFNAPLAGVVFALEVILDDFAARSFGLVVVSAVASTALVQAVLGDAPAFALRQAFALHSGLEFPLYLVLGCIMGGLALLYTQTVYFFEERFEGWRAPYWIRAAVAGVAVGLLGVATDGRVLGVGYDVIEQALHSQLTMQLLLGLAVAKVLATALTLGGGGSGGVFAPGLFVGACAGGAFGQVVHGWWPDWTALPGAYALVGMGAVFGAAAHAPITSILILFEMTDDYRIILPLMLAVVTAHLLAVSLSRDSIYSIKLRRLGGMDSPRPGLSVLDSLLVTDAMTADLPVAAPDQKVAELAQRMHREHLRSMPVLDGERHLVGIVTEHDVEEALLADDAADRTIEQIMTRQLLTCRPGEKLAAVLTRFRERTVRQIPVIDDASPPHLLGVLRREELLWAYGEVAAEHEAMLADTEGRDQADLAQSVLIDLVVQEGNPAICFRRVRELGVPERCLIVRLRRGGHDLIPRGKTRVEPGDTLTLFTTPDHASALRRWVAAMQPSKTAAGGPPASRN